MEAIMSKPLFKHYFRHVAGDDHFCEWRLTSMDEVYSGRPQPCPKCGVVGQFYQETKVVDPPRVLGQKPAPDEAKAPMTDNQRIIIASNMCYATKQIMGAIAMIKNHQLDHPEFMEKYYSELPKYSMNELGGWILAYSQANANLISREVLFSPKKSVDEIYKETLTKKEV